ncbi:uncharacterized protein MKZ38_001823 [Zalerion maritima]|uniref:Uncharacterized protein n=1 Tax=Zalerion maritima TaxID=339359 RepID=A0AAD5RRF4_9PEZI|nr:uncharacterized protein MKZ38_001823 [Zalerion maritima]
MVSQESPYALGPSPFGDSANFKMHKVLPHPKRNRVPRSHRAVPARYPLEQHTFAGTGSSSSSERSTSQSTRVPYLRHHSRRIGSGPEMPPTPPTHSRSSSSTQSILPSSPTCVATPEDSSENVATPERPSTPPNQKSPPTPDVTPPGPAATRPTRPVFSHRLRTRTGDTFKAESYRTAPEYPISDDEKSERSTLRPQLPSSKTSQNTVRQLADSRDDDKHKFRQLVGLGLGLESSPDHADHAAAPKANGDQFLVFDRNEPFIEAEGDNSDCHEYFGKSGSAKKQKLPTGPLTPGELNGGNPKVVEDDTVTPTNATKALRSMSLREQTLTEPSPNVVQDAPDAEGFWTLPSGSRSSINNDMDSRRVSMMSTKSTVSTIVEAILVDASPRRQKTLRHMRKATGLRDSSSDLATASPQSSIRPQSAEDRDSPKRANPIPKERRHDSITSNGTTSSMSSSKARRDIWKNGGVPVVVVPERRSSVKSNRPQSLRSTSSRRSKRSNSVGSTPLSSIPPSKDLAPFFERPSRRRRATLSDSGSSDSQRTIDYPPVVPVRTSSLSAHTSRNASRNTSRAASLTAESLKAQEDFQQSLEKKECQKPTPEVKLERAATIEPEKPSTHHDEDSHHAENHHLNVDTNGDPFFGRRGSIHKTPFSQASVDTNGTSAAEVSEAMAVNIYPHQNSSVLMVDHSTRPSDSSDESVKAKQSAVPKVVTTNPEGDAPVTPPQPAFSMEDVDSPLRNPRAPPEPPVTLEPPVLAFIPATPSGMTPAAEKEKMLGNFYEEVDGKPRRPSLVRRTFSRRRYSEDRSRRFSEDGQSPSLLKRTLSLSRNARRLTGERVPTLDCKGKELAEVGGYPTEEKPPPDESRLHPFWRPQYSDSEDEDDWDSEMDDEEHDGHYRYPAIDNRPPHPRRSLSSRLKRTFAILPISPEREYPVSTSEHSSGDRRTIRRTASGNLRVLKNRRISLESFHRGKNFEGPDEDRPFTAPDRAATSPARVNSLRHKPRFLVSMQHRGNGIVNPRSPSPRGKPRRSSSKLRTILGDYGFQHFPRRFNEHRREKRSRELRGKISAPKEVRDGVGDVIRRGNLRESFSGAQPRV